MGAARWLAAHPHLVFGFLAVLVGVPAAIYRNARDSLMAELER